MTEIALAFLGIFALAAIGLPLGYAMALIGFAGFAVTVGVDPARAMVSQIVFDNVLNYSFSVLPMFVLMGNLVARSRLSGELFDAANAYLGHRRGGLAMATVLACGGFSAVCGSSVATAATMVKIALPAMRQHSYADSLATGAIAAGGTLGILIPPSTVMILYGLLTGTDIAKLFAAGILPGIAMVLSLVIAIAIMTSVSPEIGPAASRSDWRARGRATLRIWGIAALFLLVMGGIYGGIFTPTEAAGIGAAGAFAFAVGRRMLTRSLAIEVLIETARTTAMMFVILFGALLFSNYVEVAGLPRLITGAIAALELQPLMVVVAIVLVYVALGCILESISMMLLTVPLFFPIVVGLGFDPVWFGIVVVVVIELSLITPPVGLNVFVIKSMAPEIPTGVIFRGVVPFVVAQIFLLALLIAWPGFTLFLPEAMQ